MPKRRNRKPLRAIAPVRPKERRMHERAGVTNRLKRVPITLARLPSQDRPEP